MIVGFLFSLLGCLCCIDATCQFYLPGCAYFSEFYFGKVNRIGIINTHSPNHLGSGQEMMSTTDASCFHHCSDYSSGEELQCWWINKIITTTNCIYFTDSSSYLLPPGVTEPVMVRRNPVGVLILTRRHDGIMLQWTMFVKVQTSLCLLSCKWYWFVRSHLYWKVPKYTW